MIFNLLLGAELWVSATGNDANPGTKSKPIATLERAQAKLRPGMTVHVNGTIYVRKPITFGPEANGVTFVGPGVISGAAPLKGWKVDEFNGRPAWSVTVPAEVSFRELWVGPNERREFRPRFPRTGFHGFTGWAKPDDAKGDFMQGQTGIRLAPGDLDQPRRNLNDIELIVHQLWTTSRLPIQGYDKASGIVQFTKKSVFHLSAKSGDELSQYYLDNVAEEFGQPGDWYLDRSEHRLYYAPRPGQKRERLVAYAPLTETAVTFKGCRNVAVRDLRFSHCEYSLPADAAGDVQAAHTVPGAVQVVDSQRVFFEGCEFSHIGGYGLEFAGTSKHCSVNLSRFHDLGAGGVTVGNGPDSILISNNEIASGGRFFPAAVGVLIRLSGHNQIVHNRIRDFYYTGISVGWDWGFADTDAKENLIAFNDIRDIGQNLLSDMGGIYVLGKQPGSRILNNRIDNVSAIGYGGWGIYLDEGSTGWTVEDNVVTNTKTGGFHIHYGGNNLIRNNIFAYARKEGQLIRSRDDKQGPIRFEHNLVVARPGDAPLVVPSWLRRDVTLTGMLYSTPKTDLPFGDDGTGRFVTVELNSDGVPPDDSEVYGLGLHRIKVKTVGPNRHRAR